MSLNICRVPMNTVLTDPEARQKMADASCDGGHGVRQRIPGRLPLDGAQARRISIICRTASPTR